MWMLLYLLLLYLFAEDWFCLNLSHLLAASEIWCDSTDNETVKYYHLHIISCLPCTPQLNTLVKHYYLSLSFKFLAYLSIPQTRYDTPSKYPLFLSYDYLSLFSHFSSIHQTKGNLPFPSCWLLSFQFYTNEASAYLSNSPAQPPQILSHRFLFVRTLPLIRHKKIRRTFCIIQ